MKLAGIAVVLVLLAAAGAQPAFAHLVSGGAGYRGASQIGQATCKHGIFGPRGVLQVIVPPPVVTGANTRARTRSERTWVRYRVWLTDAWANFATLGTSSWSSYVRVRQSGTATWTGPTVFDMDWRGNYGADVRIEWWNAKRRIGWRSYRLTEFGYINQYNVGPTGPIGTCYKPNEPGL